MHELSEVLGEDQDKITLESKWEIQIPLIHLLECTSCRISTVGKYCGVQNSKEPNQTTILYTCKRCKTTKSIKPEIIREEQYVDGVFLPGHA